MKEEQPKAPGIPEAPSVPEELQKRVNAFNEKVTPLLAEFRLGISAQPVVMPDGRLGAIPIMVDADKISKGRPVDIKEKVEEEKGNLAEA